MIGENPYEDSHDGALLVGVLLIFNRLRHYEIFSQFQRRYPNIEMSFIDGVRMDLLEKVRNGDLHFSYSTPFADYQDDPLFAHQVLYEDQLVAVMASNHPLAQHKTLSLETLAQARKFFSGEIETFSNEAAKLLLEMGVIRKIPDISTLYDASYVK